MSDDNDLAALIRQQAEKAGGRRLEERANREKQRTAPLDDGRSGRPVTETRQFNVAIRPDLKRWIAQHCRTHNLRMTDFMNSLLDRARKEADEGIE
jgi:hypothetical protein